MNIQIMYLQLLSFPGVVATARIHAPRATSLARVYRPSNLKVSNHMTGVARWCVRRGTASVDKFLYVIIGFRYLPIIVQPNDQFLASHLPPVVENIPLIDRHKYLPPARAPSKDLPTIIQCRGGRKAVM